MSVFGLRLYVHERRLLVKSKRSPGKLIASSSPPLVADQLVGRWRSIRDVGMIYLSCLNPYGSNIMAFVIAWKS